MKQKFSVIALLTVLAAIIAMNGVGVTRNATAATPAATMAATKSMAGTMAATAAAPLAVSTATIPGSGKIAKGDDKEAKKLDGSGATFPDPLYKAWFAEYKKVTGVEVNYGGGGSGKGITDIQGQLVDFAGTDGYMTDEQITAAKGGAIVHIPTAIGAVVLIVNIPEVKEPLKLTSTDVAAIFSRKVTKWNDASLVKNNPALAKIAKDIAVARRDDSSGTTNIFTSYLAAANEDWAKTFKSGNTIAWAEGTIGGKGNDGVAGTVTKTEYSIGYVELIYAIKNKLSYANVENKAGKFVAASLTSVTEAANGFLKSTPDDLRVKIVNGEGDATYPISGYTWLLAYTDQKDAAKGLAVARLLWWVTHDGQKYNEGLGYAPLPVSVVAKAEALIGKIMVAGKPALADDILKSGAMGSMMAATKPAMAATMSMAATMAATATK